MLQCYKTENVGLVRALRDFKFPRIRWDAKRARN